MNWAARRRLIILSIIGAVVFALLVIVAVITLNKAPSCSDGVQNQNESGIDCGGSCQYLCTAQQIAPATLFTKALSNKNGRIDIIASINNKNPMAAAKNVPYTVTLYGIGKSAIETVTGVTDLHPSANTPIYIPNVTPEMQKVARAFLEIDPSAPKWYTMTDFSYRSVVVSAITVSGATSTPRVDARLTNTSTANLKEIPVVVFVHNEQGEVIAASKTIVADILPQGEATATFTWNDPFTATSTSIEVIPTIPLP